MDDWKNKKVKVILESGFYYRGLVVNQDEQYIYIKQDVNGREVGININFIVSIEEVKGWW